MGKELRRAIVNNISDTYKLSCIRITHVKDTGSINIAVHQPSEKSAVTFVTPGRRGSCVATVQGAGIVAVGTNAATAPPETPA